MADPKTEPKNDSPVAAKDGDSKAADAKPALKKTADGKPMMHVRVASPFKVFFDADAVSLSGANATGPFDILPRHHNFISLLSESELAIGLPEGTATKVRISGGVMHVRADEVVVFLNV
jgi:hypothetical protein